MTNYTKACELDKGNGEYYYNWATVLGKLEWFEEAINFYNKTIESDSAGSKSNDSDNKYKAKFYKGVALRKCFKF